MRLPFVLLVLALLASPAGGAQTRAFVFQTDYSTGSLSVDDLAPRTAHCDVAPVNSDATLRWYGGLLYVVNRYGADNIQVIDPATHATLRQFSVGNGSNPHDIAFASPTRAYVTRFESTDLWIVNPVTGAHTGTVSLAAFADADGIPEMDRLAGWLAANKPAEAGGCLIHNDYKYDNLILDPQDPARIKAVLDWEMATIGDPLMDLGSTMGYWVDADDPEDWRQQSFGLTTLPGNLNREQLLARYVASSGRTVSNAVFYYAYGLFKIAVIVQQIYARYKQGLTQDARFAGLIRLVHAASRTACLAIDKQRITRLSTH